jgi:hypothetical protein
MGWRRVGAKGAIVLGVWVLAVAGAVTAAVMVADGAGGSPTAATTGSNAPIKISRQRIRQVGGGISGDVDAGVLTNLSTMLTQLGGRHHYGITITNTSNLGFIDSLEWYPPIGVRIVKVTADSQGRCRLTGVTGIGGNQFKTAVLYPNIVCENVDLKPPSCTCLGDGGSVTFAF